MTTVKTWLASAALVGGAGSGVAVGLAASGDPASPTAVARPAAATPDAGDLQQQIDALLQEDHALKRAVRRAQLRLAGQVHAGEQSLGALHRRILAAQAQLNRVQAARAGVPPVSVAAAPAAVPDQQAHATSGASGAGSGHDGSEHEGGGDD